MSDDNIAVRKRARTSDGDSAVRKRARLSVSRIFPDLYAEVFPCARFLHIFYHVALYAVSASRSSLGVARVRGSTRRGTLPAAVRAAPVALAMAELRVVLDLGVVGERLHGIPKDVLTCRLLDFRLRLLHVCGISLSPQIFAFLAASSLGGCSLAQQQDIFCTFVSCAPDDAHALLRADWSLSAGHSNHLLWDAYPGKFPAHRRVCLAASQTWWHLAIEASRLARLGLLRSVLASASESVGCSRGFLAWALQNLLRVAGDKSDTDDLSMPRLLSDVADIAVSGLDTSDLRHCLLAAIGSASSDYPSAALSEMRDRLDRLPPPRMPAQADVERHLDLFKGVVSGDCPICYLSVTRADYYLTPCKCRHIYHSTCMARHAGSRASLNIPCPTCRYVFAVV